MRQHVQPAQEGSDSCRLGIEQAGQLSQSELFGCYALIRIATNHVNVTSLMHTLLNTRASSFPELELGTK
eukprot:m.123575 g.123575  ORF g.123575 m.123575 type:complete len:70 (+) comp13754_c0_seq17:2578-2787(+)